MQCLSHISTGVRHVLVPTKHITMLLCMDRDLVHGKPVAGHGSSEDVLESQCKFCQITTAMPYGG